MELAPSPSWQSIKNERPSTRPRMGMTNDKVQRERDRELLTAS